MSFTFGIRQLGTGELLAVTNFRKDFTNLQLDTPDLRYDFDGFDFSCSKLDHAVARCGSFVGAHFLNSKLSQCDFISADMRGANFSSADLDRSDLENADCRGAMFMFTDFTDVNVTRAKFDGADFHDARNLDQAIGLAEHISVPEGEFFGYKVVYVGDQKGGHNFAVATLLIPAEARRVRGIGSDIIRVDRAFVGGILSFDEKQAYRRARSWRYPTYEYRVGRLETPTKPFDTRITEHCGAGIHLHLDVNTAIAAFNAYQKGQTPCK